MKRPCALVVLTEGEKASEAAAELFPDHVAVTSAGGANAAHQTDWGPLRGRDLVIVPDNDEAGASYAKEVVELARAAGAASVRIVDLPPGLPVGWDLADAAPEGLDVRALLDGAAPVKEPALGAEKAQGRLALRSFTGSSLAGKSVLARPWLVRNVVPRRQVTMLSGAGATGKSLLALQLGIAVATGTRWIDLSPEVGSVVYVSAEDDEDEIHRRLVDIAGDVSTLQDLHVVPLAGEDAVLAAPARGSEMLNSTALWQSLVAKVRHVGPRLVIIDTLADAFAGNENSRPQARQFIGLLRGLAISYDLAVVVLAHPSQSGASAGTSGSTGWDASVRSRLFFERVEGDPNARKLSVKKSNYGPPGQEFMLCWSTRGFVLDGGGSSASSSVTRSAADAIADAKFLELLALVTAQGRDVTDKTGRSYAPSIFADNPSAGGIKSRGFASAMERLLAAHKIKIVWSGSPSKRRSRLVASE